MRSMNTERIPVVRWFAFSYALLKLCSAQNPTCTVTQDADQTTYSISGLPHVLDVEASQCEHSWTSDRVLAHHMTNISELVKRNSINAFVMSECVDKIIYTRSCISEGEEYTINCTISCSGNSSFQNDKGISHSHIAAVVAAVVVVVVVSIMVLVVLFRDKRIFSCGQLGCMYTAVDTQNINPNNQEAVCEAGETCL